MWSFKNNRTRFNKFLPKNESTRNVLIMGLAEFIGTALLVFIGCMGCVGTLGGKPSHLQITLTFGLAVLLIIQCIGHISNAHINPAITVGAFILGKKSLQECTVYFFAQLLGAISGYGLLKVVTPLNYLSSMLIFNETLPIEDDRFCTTDLHSQVSAVQGLLLEGIATAVLMFVACAIWDERNKNNMDSVPVKFGLTVTALATVVGPYTGCSMNPARSLAPAIWNNYWFHHWIYWCGPIGGALFASFMYKNFFEVKEEEETEETLPEVTLLNTMTIDDTQKAE